MRLRTLSLVITAAAAFGCADAPTLGTRATAAEGLRRTFAAAGTEFGVPPALLATYSCSLNGNAECALNGVQSNHFTIGVEHGGYASQSSFPTAQIDASARLVCDVARDRGITRDNVHIVGHAKLQPANRTDPGPNWPWADYLARINRYCAT